MKKQLEILINPHPLLRKKSEVIALARLKDKKFQNFLEDLEETMIKKDGAGLAAPQVGQNIRVIVVNYNEKTTFLINPQITKKSWACEIEEEGCLSVLNKKGEIIYAPVKRHKKINCLYFDKQGKKQKIAAEKLLARIIQHEVDHLDGILFLDRLESFPSQIKTKEKK